MDWCPEGVRAKGRWVWDRDAEGDCESSSNRCFMTDCDKERSGWDEGRSPLLLPPLFSSILLDGKLARSGWDNEGRSLLLLPPLFRGILLDGKLARSGWDNEGRSLLLLLFPL